ncbi:DUF4174 domain-containing protein [Zunongwangia atlantica]|uniref:DUF4174 domain-containing protein n=1 Tax=Zunongwangia atlantica 22II14-10F7 TaxID=1185767 RepID=A0A1Y1T4K1_9FLAO|nr:DUF4174 domain-containing protein [Zunongwangia atlantica]ORL45971.1 hypothetical protein IIF7_07621 [Zunongwangia atlantica 22II14-10F7]
MKLLVITFFSIMALGNIDAQEKEAHQWENRLVLLLTNSIDNSDFKQQLGEFRNQEKDLEDRKIVVYQVTPKKYATGTSDKPDWNKGDNFYEKFKSSNSGFELILIGLDGGTKLRKIKYTPANEIFEKIDSMPMRQAELDKSY